MNEKDYQNYVKLGKAELKTIEGHQRRIAEYAIKVCTIRHGGRSNGYYTLTDYANDIGMNIKTLQNWVQIYKNVILKLDKKRQDKATWKQAASVNQFLKEDRTIDNQINERPRGSKMAYKSDIHADKVQKLYDNMKEAKPFETEFITITQAAKNMKNVLTKRDLSIIPDDRWGYLMKIIDECSDIINDHLTKNKKNKKAV